jgi:hypothetical protein
LPILFAHPWSKVEQTSDVFCYYKARFPVLGSVGLGWTLVGLHARASQEV